MSSSLGRPTTWPRHLAAGALLAVAAIAGLSGCVTRETVVVHEPAPAPRPIVVRHMPAPIREDRGPQPAPGWGYVPGHWKWEANDWAWVHGQWVRQAVPPMPVLIVEQPGPPPSPVHFWVPGHWVWHFDGGNSWIWVAGSWHR